jgi:hypothetical protein
MPERKDGTREVKLEVDTGSAHAGTPAEPPDEQVMTTIQAQAAGGTGVRANNPLPTLTVRVMRLEAMVNTIINRVPDLEGRALQDWRISES